LITKTDARSKPTQSCSSTAAAAQKSVTGIALLTPKEAAFFLKVSGSWLAKSRMRGDGPPYIRIGRSVRYRLEDLVRWLKGQQRFSTAEQCS
jgi:hypothetical protein